MKSSSSEGHLVSARNVSEWNFIQAKAKEKGFSELWIGLSDVKVREISVDVFSIA